MNFNNTKCVLIISNKWDVHAHAVVNEITSVGGNVVRINTEDFAKAKLTIDPVLREVNICLYNGKVIKEDHITSGYLRRILAPPLLCDMDPIFTKFCEREFQTIIFSLPYIFKNVKWLNSTFERMKVSNKIYQLFVAQSVGLSIPETIISNDSSMVLKKSKLWNETIFKSIDIPIGEIEDKPNTYIEVNPFKFENLDQIPEAELRINLCPGQWQKFIDKKYELRIHVVDKKIIAVKIDSQKNLDAKVDWRPFARELDYFEYELPCKMRDLILIFMQNMGIKLGVIDMIVTSDDQYIFLEVNPDGNWLWIEDFLPNIGITRSIASWLLSD